MSNGPVWLAESAGKGSVAMRYSLLHFGEGRVSRCADELRSIGGVTPILRFLTKLAMRECACRSGRFRMLLNTFPKAAVSLSVVRCDSHALTWAPIAAACVTIVCFFHSVPSRRNGLRRPGYGLTRNFATRLRGTSSSLVYLNRPFSSRWSA